MEVPVCGLVGFYGDCDARTDVLHAMMNSIVHRGPDNEGEYSDATVALGFRRLSIIDIDEGAQPIFNEDRSLVLVFNGEIYNYQALRAQLIDLGHTFTTHSDSEVLVHAYEEYGADMLPKLRGMFAFAIFNAQTGDLFAARDYFGVKPFYYYHRDDVFVFGSEIKSILLHPGVDKKLNLAALDNYLSFQYGVPEQTFFTDITCLPAGHYLEVTPQRNADGVLVDFHTTLARWFEPSFEIDESITMDEAVERLDAAMTDSVSAHRIADVEVGCFLSGGVDSSLIASYFSGQKAFTVGFANDGYDETDYAKELAAHCGLDHYTKIIEPEEFWQVVPRVQYMMDQPLADPAAIAMYFVSAIAAEKVKVVLSGEGSDELFGGYNIYQEPYAVGKAQRLPLPLRKAAAAVALRLPRFKGQSYLARAAQTVEERFIGNASIFSLAEKKRLLAQPGLATAPQTLTRPFYDCARDWDDMTKMQYIDINLWLVGDILLAADRMSMAHSLELRVPYLDRDVFAVARALPTLLRVSPAQTKAAMREVAKRHVPQNSAGRKKLGFPVPIRVWLRQREYYDLVRAEFDSDAARQFFQVPELLRLLDDHRNSKADNSRKIWTVYMFLVWHKAYFGTEAPHAA